MTPALVSAIVFAFSSVIPEFAVVVLSELAEEAARDEGSAAVPLSDAAVSFEAIVLSCVVLT